MSPETTSVVTVATAPTVFPTINFSFSSGSATSIRLIWNSISGIVQTGNS
jgi:hypothetical protein